jgi:hypothetical protein
MALVPLMIRWGADMSSDRLLRPLYKVRPQGSDVAASWMGRHAMLVNITSSEMK